ncbi:MAG: hypothetical protein DYG89_23840 [Caldilinea sp. CFX5]|nr:hypothetical protein [Caldilinea sp. CFX5]
MKVQLPNNSAKAILQRLNAELREPQTLCQAVQAMPQEQSGGDLVAVLAGSLGPAVSGEAELFNTFELTWQRFTDEPEDWSK